MVASTEADRQALGRALSSISQVFTCKHPGHERITLTPHYGWCVGEEHYRVTLHCGKGHGDTYLLNVQLWQSILVHGQTKGSIWVVRQLAQWMERCIEGNLGTALKSMEEDQMSRAITCHKCGSGQGMTWQWREDRVAPMKSDLMWIRLYCHKCGEGVEKKFVYDSANRDAQERDLKEELRHQYSWSRNIQSFHPKATPIH